MKIIEDKVFKLQIFMNNHLLVFRQSDGKKIAVFFQLLQFLRCTKPCGSFKKAAVLIPTFANKFKTYQ